MKVYRRGEETPDLTPRPGVYYVSKWRGLIVVKKWPRRRKRIHPNQQDAVDAFKRATWMARNVPAIEQTVAMDMARTGPFTWKDILLMSYYGTLYTARTEDGELIAPWRLVMDTIQELLAAIGDQQAMLLYHDGTKWAALLAGDDGKVLTAHGSSANPTWETASGGGGSGVAALGLRTPVAPVSTDFAWKAGTQGGAVLTDDADFGFTIQAASVSTPNMRLFGQAVPAGTAWSIVAAPRMLSPINLNTYDAGIYLRDSVGGKILAFHLRNGIGSMQVMATKWNSATAFSASIASFNCNYNIFGQPLWFRLRFDNVSYYFDWSTGGVYWLNLGSIGKTAFLAAAADECGVFVNPTNATPTNIMYASFFDWHAA